MRKVVAESSDQSMQHSTAQRNSADLRRFLYRMIGFTSLQLLVSLIFVVPYCLKYDEAVNRGYVASTIDKHQLLATAKSPRVIFVGGSSVAFGIDSPYIKQKLNYNPVNMGIHAGLGAEYMLNEVKPSLKAGDVVVISLEYETFNEFPPDPKQVFDALEARKENARFLSIDYVSTLFDKGLILTGSLLRRSMTTLTTGKIERLPYYTREGFNADGDVVAHYKLPDDEQKLKGEGRYYRFKPERIDRTVQALNEFHRYAESKGAKTVYVYPPLMPTLLKMNRSEISKVEAALTRSLSFPIFGTPETVAYSDNDYFDTRYHLNRTGVQQRSEFLVKELTPYLSK